MITVLTYHTPELVKKALITLPINEFRVVELSHLKKLKHEQADVFIIHSGEIKFLTSSMLEQKALVIFMDDKETLSSIYQQAKELHSFAMISTTDLKSIDQTIRNAYTAILNKRKSEFPKGKKIGVFSTKGGTGKSFLAYHLAFHLQSFISEKILLTDLGTPFGSLKSLFNQESNGHWGVLRPLLQTGKGLTTSRLSAQMTHVHQGFDVLATPANFSDKTLSAEELHHLLTSIQQLYSATIIDFSSEAISDMPAYLSQLDLCLYVMTPDSNSFRQTVEFQQLLQQKNLEKKVMFVCNLYEPSQDTQLIKGFEKLLGKTIELIESDIEAVKFHQRKFSLFSDETFLVTKQLKELARKVFFTLTNQLS